MNIFEENKLRMGLRVKYGKQTQIPNSLNEPNLFSEGYVEWLENKILNHPNAFVNAIQSSTILFAVYLTGHDEETIKQMYNDWKVRN